MAFYDTDLGSGTISAATTTSLAAAESGKYKTVYDLILTNSTSNIITVTIQLYNGTTARTYEVVKIPAGSGKTASLKNKNITLGYGLTLRAVTTTTDSFNYKVNGNIKT